MTAPTPEERAAKVIDDLERGLDVIEFSVNRLRGLTVSTDRIAAEIRAAVLVEQERIARHFEAFDNKQSLVSVEWVIAKIREGK